MNNNLFENVTVNSSAIKSAGYFNENNLLVIKFINNREYNYLNVPYHIFEGIRSAESKGKFINKYVLKHYEFTPLV